MSLLTLLVVTTAFLYFILLLKIKKDKNLNELNKNDAIQIFRFPKIIRNLMYVIACVFPLLFMYGFIQSPTENDPAKVQNWIGLFFFTFLSWFVGFYSDSKEIILTNNFIQKKSIFGSLKFELTSINRMIIDFSSGNPVSAQTFLYCNGQKMILESFLVNYRHLLWELRYNKCKNAVIVEKNV